MEITVNGIVFYALAPETPTVDAPLYMIDRFAWDHFLVYVHIII